MFSKIYCWAADKELIRSLLQKNLSVDWIKNEAVLQYGEISLINNSDFNNNLLYDFPDGFLFFPWILEIDFIPDTDINLCIDVVNKITSALWHSNITAVVACDFEDLLEKTGGYGRKDIFWPIK